MVNPIGRWPLVQTRAAIMRAAACVLLGLVAGCGDEQPAAPTPSASPTPAAFDTAAFRDAARITGLAENEVLRTVRPGLFERDIKATIDAVFRREGVTEFAFPHIVASGPNAIDLHYAGDSRQLQEGDLLVIDIGATVSAHCADVTRTYPVSGRYTPRQRELYQLVLDAQREAAARARTGVDSLASIHVWVRDYFRDSPLRARDSSGNEQTMEQFFVHFVGHYVGRTVHGQDTGWNSNDPIALGQVLTLEPGLYVASEGIGIRIEDDYLVTRVGLECLSPESPTEIAEIERLMASPRALPAFSDTKMLPRRALPAANGKPHMDFGPIDRP